jgi:hypothetical protein
MFKKLAIASCLSLGAMTFGSAQAVVVSCPTNVANAVNGDIGCQYSTLQPANEGEATVTAFVNSEAYFGNTDWLFGGSLSIGTGASGTWSLAGLNITNWDDVMLLFKGGTNPLVGYLFPDGTTSGTWTTPFLDGPPPFDLPGNSTQQNVSFIRVFYTPGPGGGETPGNGGKVPEPATLGLLGLGLVGLAMIRRRKS